MFNIPVFEAGLFRRCFFEDDKEACRELYEGFWDRHYLWKFGLWPQPYVIPERRGPQPDPIPDFVERAAIHEYLLVGLIDRLSLVPDAQLGAPSPDPISRLLDPCVRLESARRLSEKLRQVSAALDKEIEWLEHQHHQGD